VAALEAKLGGSACLERGE